VAAGRLPLTRTESAGALADHLLGGKRGPSRSGAAPARRARGAREPRARRTRGACRARSRRARYVVREQVHCELHVLADFPAVGALEPGPEQLERPLELYLRRSPG
jgi:hypothetical protein